MISDRENREQVRVAGVAKSQTQLNGHEISSVHNTALVLSALALL
jgi:hypothetical protein